MAGQLKDIRVPLAIVVAIVLFTIGLSLGSVKYIYGQDTKRLDKVEIQGREIENRLIRLEEKFIASQEKMLSIKKDVEKISAKQDQAALMANENTKAILRALGK